MGVGDHVQEGGDAGDDAVKVACGKCGGTGQRPLTKVEAATIAVLTEEWQDTRDVQEKLSIGRRPVKNTTLCNRLMRLLSLGLVERQDPETDGRMRQWRKRL